MRLERLHIDLERSVEFGNTLAAQNISTFCHGICIRKRH